MPKLYKPKFKIGDTVWMKNEDSFNPANEVISVGRITAIHIYKGKSLFSRRMKNGEFKSVNYSGRVIYTISGFSDMPEEKDLQLFTGEA